MEEREIEVGKRRTEDDEWDEVATLILDRIRVTSLLASASSSSPPPSWRNHINENRKNWFIIDFSSSILWTMKQVDEQTLFDKGKSNGHFFFHSLPQGTFVSMKRGWRYKMCPWFNQPFEFLSSFAFISGSFHSALYCSLQFLLLQSAAKRSERKRRERKRGRERGNDYC